MRGYHGMKTETVIQSANAAPAVGGTILAVATLNEWVAIATLVYILLQSAFLVWKWHKEAKKG